MERKISKKVVGFIRFRDNHPEYRMEQQRMKQVEGKLYAAWRDKMKKIDEKAATEDRECRHVGVLALRLLVLLAKCIFHAELLDLI